MSIDPNEYQLPCDVKLPPATRIKRGCTLNTLLVAMQQRESYPPAERVFNDATPPAAQVQGERPEVVGHLLLGAPFSSEELGDIDAEWDFKVAERLQCELATNDDVSLPLMTVAQHERIVAGTVEHYRAQFAELHAARNLLSRLSMAGFELGDDPASSIIAALSAPPAAGVPEIPVQWSKSLSHCWPQYLDDKDGDWCVGTVDEDGRLYEVLLVEAAQYDAPGESQKIAEAIVALWSFADAPTPPASEQQQAVVMPVAILIDTLERTRETIDGQLEIIAARAHGSHLDKAPVVRSLRAHRARCDEALTEYNAELQRLNPHLQPAAPSQGESE